MIIGSDLADYDGIASELGASVKFRGIRYYAGGGGTNVNIFPTPWPLYGPGTRLLMSVYPVVPDLLAGRLDDLILDMIAGAPPGSMLTAWHEVLSLPYPQKYLTPPNVLLMHRKMAALCKGSNVSYGCLLGGGDLTFLMRYLPNNLGFYGLDLYGNLGFKLHPRWQHPFHRWIQFRNLAKTKDKIHGYPQLVIGETNVPDQALRGAWFETVASWVHGYGPNGAGVFTFWSDNAHLGGPWDPNDKATISALKAICSKYAK
jgi:hypothetical protein